MKKNPKISIVIPVYNSEEMVQRLLESIRAQKTQHTYEIIIADDGSEKPFEEIAKQYNAKYVRSSVNMGQANARNLGVEIARGEIIYFIDVDGIPQENWLDKLLVPFSNKNIGIVGGSIKSISKSIFSKADDLSMFPNFSRNCPEGYREGLTTLNFAIRKNVFDEVGGFDPTFRTSEDFDLCFRVKKKGYKIFFYPPAEVVHDHQRKSFIKFIARHYRAGNLGGGRTRVKYKKEVKSFRFFPSNSFLLLLLSPLYAFLATLRIVFTSFEQGFSAILLFPIVFIGKFTWMLGAFGGVRKYNRRKNSKGFLFNNIEAIFLKNRYRLPLNLIFHVTFRCNSRCITCFNWKSLNTQQQKELSIEEIKRIAKSLSRISSLALSGGEPFLRPDVDQICEIFYTENSVRSITIPTNCLLPEIVYEKTKSILDLCPKSRVIIALSVDGTEKMHDSIRGVKGNFLKFIETSKKLAELKKEYPNLALKVNSTIFGKNIDNLLDLAEFVITEMPEIDTHSFELMRGETKYPSLALPSTDKLEEYSKKLGEIWDKHKPFKSSNIKSKITTKLKKYLFSLHIETLKKKKQLIPCYAGKLYGVLYPFGEVRLCELLPPIGNIREAGYDFLKVWNSKIAATQKNSIKNKKCHCTHTCFQLSSVMANPKLYPKVLAQ